MKDIYKQWAPIRHLENIFSSGLERDFSRIWVSDSSSLLSISDYSGDRPGDKYNAYAFFLIDKAEAATLLKDIIRFKGASPDLNNNSYFEFKKIGRDKVRKRLLPEFLSIIGRFRAALVVFLIEKDFAWLGNDSQFISEYFIKKGFGEWAPHIVKKKLETLLLAGYLISKLDDKFKKVIWISDRDSRIGDNPSHQESTKKILEMIFNGFELRYEAVDLFLQNCTPLNEELNSVADLASGCLLDIFDNPSKVKDFSLDYFKWFSAEKSNLGKRCYVIQKENGNPSVVEVFQKI